MFFANFFNRREPALEDDRLLRSHPRDAHGRIVFLDDEVVHRGRVLRVVAMSHKGKIVVRDPRSQGSGGKWVPASTVVVRGGGAR